VSEIKSIFKPNGASELDAKIEERDRRRLLMQVRELAGVGDIPISLTDAAAAIREFVKERMRSPVMVGVPTRGYLTQTWLENWQTKMVPYWTAADTFRTHAGPDIAGNRDALCRFFMNETEYDWLIQIDDDVIHMGSFDPLSHMQALAREENCDFIAGAVPLSKYPFNPNVFTFTRPDASIGRLNVEDGKWYLPDGQEVAFERAGRYMEVSEFSPTTVMEVAAVGAAWLMVSRKALEAIGGTQGPWFVWGEGGAGEDVAFCWRAHQAGLKMLVDFRLTLGHLKQLPITLDWYVGHRAAEGLYGQYQQKMHEVYDTMDYNVKNQEFAPHLKPAVGEV
jgi:hypothetical protein